MSQELTQFFYKNIDIIKKYLKSFSKDIPSDEYLKTLINNFVDMNDVDTNKLFKYTLDKNEDEFKLLYDNSYINNLNLDINNKKKILFFYTYFRNLIDINKFNSNESNLDFNYDFNYDVYKNITNEDFFSLDYHNDNIIYEDNEKIIYKL